MHLSRPRSDASSRTRISVKPWAFRSFLLFIALLGWIPSFSFLAEHHPLSDAQSGISRQVLVAAPQLQFREGQPPFLARIDIEREPEVEEEEEVHPDDKPLAGLHHGHLFADEARYARAIGTQLSQLQSRLFQRAPLDFVLLFHCWKTDPC